MTERTSAAPDAHVRTVVVTSDEFNNEGRVIFTIATTFPWGGE